MPRPKPEGRIGASTAGGTGGSTGSSVRGTGSSGGRTSGSKTSGYRAVVNEARATKMTPTSTSRSVPRSVERWSGTSAQRSVIDMYLTGNSAQKAAAKRIMNRWIVD